MDKKVFWLSVLLFLSLSGNFFLGGIVMGRSAGHPPQENMMKNMAERDAELQRLLPAADRALVKAEMERTRAAFGELRQKLDIARKDVAAAARAEPFDQELLDDTMRTEKEAKMALLKYIQETRRGITEKLSPEGQAVIARLMPPSHPRRPKPAMDHGQDEYVPFIWEEAFIYGGEEMP